MFLSLDGAFADPPPWVKTDEFYLPYSVSVGLWYAMSVGFAMWAVFMLARAVLPDAVPERGAGGMPRPFHFTSALAESVFRWAAARSICCSWRCLPRHRDCRTWPANSVRALARHGHRIQVDPGISCCCSPSCGETGVRESESWRPWSSVWERSRSRCSDRRKAMAQHEFFVKTHFSRAATGEGDHPMGKDLTETTATDSQSFVAAMHHIRHRDLPREDRPTNAAKDIRLVHWAISGALTLITLYVAWRRLTPEPKDQLVFFGCLCALLMVVSPISHMHYYAMVLPLVSALWLRSLHERPGAIAADAPRRSRSCSGES